MNKTAILGILREIDSLVDEDRISLDRELSRRFAGEWKLEAAKARKTAKVRKIDQKAIDQAIERRRYGA